MTSATPSTPKLWLHSPELSAQRRVLHVLEVLLLPAAHGAQVEGAAAVEAGQGGQVGTVEGVLCKHSRGRGGEGTTR